MRKWGEAGTTDLVETLLTTWPQSPPIQAYIQQTHNMFPHTHIYTNTATCRWTETRREKGERLTDLLPQFYL